MATVPSRFWTSVDQFLDRFWTGLGQVLVRFRTGSGQVKDRFPSPEEPSYFFRVAMGQWS